MASRGARMLLGAGLPALMLCAGVAGAADTPAMVDRLGKTAGRLHPLVVHFPIALIITACVIEMWFAVRRRARVSPTGLMCLWIGAVGAGVAAFFGWLNASYEGASSDTVELHRWIGIATAVLAVVVAVAGAVMRGGAVGVRGYRLGLLIAAGLVGFGGHLGGMITYGDTYLTDAIRDVFSPRAVVARQGGREGGKEGEPTESRGGAPVDLAAIRFPADGKIEFVRDVKPIFAASCYECHGAKKRKGQLRLDTKSAAEKGGKSGSLFVAGKPEESQLIDRVKGLGDEQPMPLDKDPLPPECIKILEAWVSQGGMWPDDGSGGVSSAHDEEEKHWAYVAPVRREPPASTKHPHWARNPIDSFVLAKLESKKMGPSPEAEKATLIRRVSLDLTGLPPAPDEVEAFLADSRVDAYERLVDRLLGSPRYGERWARPWLDLARYADSHGYEKDLGRSVWPYRDWVIEALNADMPFDRFTVEQLAGDLLPSPSPSQVIATGFNRNTMINEEGGVDPEEYRVNAVVDRANATSTIWLGATLGCAQCHDHKFDPFTQKDYYRFFAFFNTSEVESKLTPIGEFLEISPRVTIPDPVGEPRRRIVRMIESAIRELGDDAPETATLRTELNDARTVAAPEVTTLVMREMSEPRKSYVLQRGSFLNPGDEVEPGVPAALGKLAGASETAAGPAASGVVPGVFPPAQRTDRLALAEWLVSPENPVTARVTVNHLWEQHFGHGIVETSEDFGSRGAAPSHPELLDWLATELVRQKWSMKAMHRLIVTSATYRQKSRVTPALLEADPQNKLLARGARFRLDAEMVRDQALAIGGVLSLKMGGPPVFPVQPEGVWASPYNNNHWATSTGEDLHRRGIYTFWKRASPYPAFVAFDAPNRTVTCTRRPRTNTPLQALTTLNDPVFVEAAAGLARRIMSVDAGPEARMDFGVRVCLARGPTAEERNRLLALYQEQLSGFANDVTAARELVAAALPGERIATDAREMAAWTVVANVLLNLDEVLNRG